MFLLWASGVLVIIIQGEEWRPYAQLRVLLLLLFFSFFFFSSFSWHHHYEKNISSWTSGSWRVCETPAQQLLEAWEKVPAVVCHGFCHQELSSQSPVHMIFWVLGPYTQTCSCCVLFAVVSGGCLLTFSTPLLHLFGPVLNFWEPLLVFRMLLLLRSVLFLFHGSNSFCVFPLVVNIELRATPALSSDIISYCINDWTFTLLSVLLYLLVSFFPGVFHSVVLVFYVFTLHLSVCMCVGVHFSLVMSVHCASIHTH